MLNLFKLWRSNLLDLFEQIDGAPFYTVVWVAFTVGLAGSLHCVGMCGGLVAACSNEGKNTWAYQIGRLIGYSILGLFAGLLGNIMTVQKIHPVLTLIPSILIGGILINWGVSGFKGRSLKFKIPKFLEFISLKLLSKAMKVDEKKHAKTKAALVGGLSIFLPCGFLYGVVFALAILQQPVVGLIAMIAFWAGTTPALSLSTQLIEKILTPIRSYAPKFSSAVLVSFGVGTISYRLYNFIASGGQSCH